jgi:uncharacterized protein (DUF1501 family)
MTMHAILHATTRRTFLAGTGALFAWAFVPKAARAQGRDPRFLTIVLRGGLDGLAVVSPVGDPDWIKLRGDNALRLDGATPALPLDGFFALNPAMPNLHRLYRAGQAIAVQAVATPYRDRSHFDGQDVLESGFARPGHTDDGWLNRALSGLEVADRVRAGPHGGQAFAVGPITPLVVRGSAPVLSWVPSRLPPVSSDTTARLLDLYRHTDPTLARVLEERIELAALVPGAAPGAGDKKPVIQVGNVNQVRAYFVEAAGTAAEFLAKPDGPRIGALALDGWDTHANEGAATGRLSQLLAALDGALAAIETNMGSAWNQTVVTLITEFGRTARINGTEGTDHGTATVALLAGGALKGGRVIADWPGVKPSNLLGDRDLRPTTDLRAVLKGLLRDHLHIEERALMTEIFPGSEGVNPVDGLLA